MSLGAQGLKISQSRPAVLDKYQSRYRNSRQSFPKLQDGLLLTWQGSSSMSLPHVLKRIRLELARSKEFPMDSARHGYEFVAPLDGKGHIDPHLWQKYRDHCGVRRFWNGEDEEIG